MNWFNTLWNVPANTQAEDVRPFFEQCFGAENVRIPPSGVMPASQTGQGRNIVHCLLAYDHNTAVEMVEEKGHNWQVWGYQTYDGAVVTVPVKHAVVNFIPDRWETDGNGEKVKIKAELSWMHKYQGQADWVEE